MAVNFSFATAGQIIFGNHTLDKVPDLVAGFGKKVILVTGKSSLRAEELMAKFSPGTDTILFKVPGEPTTDLIEAGVKLAREHNSEVVVGFGGGSVIDSAKAIAAMGTNKGELLDYLEVIGRGKPLTERPLPCIAIPTTAGTGAEATKNAVIKSPENNVKVSLRSSQMYPDIAVVDPVLTWSMPPALTASTGVDALTHLLETFVSNQANPFIDMICREGLTRISRSLRKAFTDGADKQAREDMAMASLLGGMALANVKLGAVHGFAGPMGGMFPIPHGAVCACLMSAVIEENIQALRNNKLDSSKFDELAKILTGNEKAMSNDAAIWASELVAELQVSTLSEFGLTQKDFPLLIEKAKVSSSIKGNPVELTDEQLFRILERSL
ncbi:iron-containing alcohol dehydrogenase [Draconibacterium halophilum]|uniref:Iron-containing alcohol dehydrogenase n=1 Tax=Draconibacterium halophilum TaxID=2706887 RepID=A0A6C0R8Y0_9BACT|nr:iron-containing alcohol dehydrogenase [Draconibacterium halophilum]QIA06938.1 iron-containing alcohol dehydrogenase [Draconibacterium halophilum]